MFLHFFWPRLHIQSINLTIEEVSREHFSLFYCKFLWLLGQEKEKLIDVGFCGVHLILKLKQGKNVNKLKTLEFRVNESHLVRFLVAKYLYGIDFVGNNS